MFTLLVLLPCLGVSERSQERQQVTIVAYTLIRSCNGGRRRSEADIFLRIIQALRCRGINPVD